MLPQIRISLDTHTEPLFQVCPLKINYVQFVARRVADKQGIIRLNGNWLDLGRKGWVYVS